MISYTQYFRYIYLLLIAIVFVSAKPEGCNESTQTPYIGEWRWVKTNCCFRSPVNSTPKSCSCTKRLILNIDSTFERYEDDALTGKGTYQIRKGISDYASSNGEIEPVIVFSEDAPSYYYFQKDTLVISKGYIDLQTDYYVPVKKK